MKLKVKIEEELREEIITDTGVPQSDCMSALIFILYLAHALKPEQSPEDQGLRRNIITEPHPTSGRKESITLEGQYADDMFTITTNIEENHHHQEQIGHVVTSWVTPYSASLSLHASRSPQMSISC